MTDVVHGVAQMLVARIGEVSRRDDVCPLLLILQHPMDLSAFTSSRMSLLTSLLNGEAVMAKYSLSSEKTCENLQATHQPSFVTEPLNPLYLVLICLVHARHL
jgi:hypothetical protein